MPQFPRTSPKKHYAMQFRAVTCPECAHKAFFTHCHVVNPSVIEVGYQCHNPACYQSFSLQTTFDYVISSSHPPLHAVFIAVHSLRHKRTVAQLHCPVCGQAAIIKKTTRTASGDDGIHCRCVSEGCQATFRLTRRFHRRLSLSRPDALRIAKLTLLKADDKALQTLPQTLGAQPQTPTDKFNNNKG